MKMDDILLEIPKDIDPIDWHNINDLAKNHQLFLKLSADEHKKLILNISAGISIYRLSSQYFCLDPKDKRVTYFMHYLVGNNGKIGDFVWQSLVWTNPKYAYLSGLPQKIFFEQLLPKFGTIITDSEQTWDGKRFWKLRLRDAFDLGLNVYYYNFQDHQCIKMEDYGDFENIEEEVWGPSDLRKMRRMLITSKTLSERR